ncbi:MAG: hypothetical protein HOQ05_09095 [Corynebacteriales bacterium]|nr:hypothetical protein [Mycobacteriales bacterium]
MRSYDDFNPEGTRKQREVRGISVWSNVQAAPGEPKVLFFGSLEHGPLVASKNARQALTGVKTSSSFFTFAPEGKGIDFPERIDMLNQCALYETAGENSQSPLVCVLSADFVADLLKSEGLRRRAVGQFCNRMREVAAHVVVSARPGDFQAAPAFVAEKSSFLIAEEKPYLMLCSELTKERLGSLAEDFVDRATYPEVLESDINQLVHNLPAESARLSKLRTTVAFNGTMPATILAGTPQTYAFADRSQADLWRASVMRYCIIDGKAEASPDMGTATIFLNRGDNAQAVTEFVLGMRKSTNRAVVHDLSDLPAELWTDIDGALKHADISPGMRHTVVLRSKSGTVPLHNMLAKLTSPEVDRSLWRPGQALRRGSGGRRQ